MSITVRGVGRSNEAGWEGPGPLPSSLRSGRPGTRCHGEGRSRPSNRSKQRSETVWCGAADVRPPKRNQPIPRGR
eukprot:scaffold519_cov331-Pavlova_lutheri.AAC.31